MSARGVLVLLAWVMPFTAAHAQARLDVVLDASTGDLDLTRRIDAIDRVRTELSMCDPAGAADLRASIDASGAITLTSVRRARSAESRAFLACATRHLPPLEGTGAGTLTFRVSLSPTLSLDALPTDRRIGAVTIRVLSGLASPVEVRAVVAAHLAELETAVARCDVRPGVVSYGIAIAGERSVASLVGFEGRDGEAPAACVIPTVEEWPMPESEGPSNVMLRLEITGAPTASPPSTALPSDAPTARISIRVASGPLAAADVDRIFARQRRHLDAALVRCDAEGAAIEDGTITVTVSADGRVAAADPTGASGTCLSPRVLRWVFPRADAASELRLLIDR